MQREQQHKCKDLSVKGEKVIKSALIYLSSIKIFELFVSQHADSCIHIANFHIHSILTN